MYSTSEADPLYSRGVWENGLRASRNWQHNKVTQVPYRSVPYHATMHKMAPHARTLPPTSQVPEGSLTYSVRLAQDTASYRERLKHNAMEQWQRQNEDKAARNAKCIPYEPFVSENARQFQPPFPWEYNQFTPTKHIEALQAHHRAVADYQSSDPYYQARLRHARSYPSRAQSVTMRRQ